MKFLWAHFEFLICLIESGLCMPDEMQFTIRGKHEGNQHERKYYKFKERNLILNL